MKNAYAIHLMAAKAAFRAEEKKQIVTETVQLMHGVYALAMNQALGIGADRLCKVMETAMPLFQEYSDMMDVDPDYAKAKLSEAYSQIMGKRKEKSEDDS